MASEVVNHLLAGLEQAHRDEIIACLPNVGKDYGWANLDIYCEWDEIARKEAREDFNRAMTEI